MVLASPNEGGPIVLLEAWAVRVPFFMRRTGIAAQYPDNVFIIDDDESAASVAARVEYTINNIKSSEVQKVLDGGWKTLRKWYTTIREAWDDPRAQRLSNYLLIPPSFPLFFRSQLHDREDECTVEGPPHISS